MSSMAEALEVFRRHWGHDRFRSFQETVIEQALEGQDVLAVQPTGAGKSACFQVPALVDEGTALVVSPLIALMNDQVRACEERGIPATCLHSNMDDGERVERVEAFIGGSYKLVYIAPERIQSTSFIEAIQRADISRIVVDEAHCCSQWGHDFRPDYMHIHRLIASVTKRGGERPPVMAVTATATQLVVEDILTSLGLPESETVVIVGDPRRANLSYEVENAGGIHGYGNSWGILRDEIAQFDMARGRHIIYCGTRKGAESVADIVAQVKGQDLVAHYHAGMKPSERTEVETLFANGERPVICATTAFGMGIDVENIRTVINFGIPGSLEDYVQQIGRAGRDGAPSRCVLIVDDKSIAFQTRLVENANPPWNYYALLWEWLHREMQPGSTLRMTAAEIAQGVTAMRQGALSAEQVSVVLNRMHSAALIERRDVDAGTPVTISLAVYEEMMHGLGAAVVKHVWRTMWEKCAVPSFHETPPTGDHAVVMIGKRLLAELSGVSEYMVGKALDVGLKKGGILHVGDAFRGKTVRILRWRAELDKEMPVARINAKRDSDFARLHQMLDYAKLRTEAQRREFIRSYFLGAEDSR